MSGFGYLVLIIVTGIAALLVGLGLGYLVFNNQSQKKKNNAKGMSSPNHSRKQRTDGFNDRIRKMYQLITDLTMSLNYERVLEKSIDAVMMALRLSDYSTDRLVGAVFLFSEDEHGPLDLYVASSRGLPRPDVSRTTPGIDGLLEEVIESGNNVLSHDLAEDPELSQFLAFQSSQSGFCMPLRSGFDTFGVLIFAHPEDDYFDSDVTEIINTVGHQAQIALQNAHLFQELKTEKDQIIKIQKEARQKLARALHDGPTQTVAAIPMQISRARHLLKRDVDAAAEALFQTEDLARRTSRQLRHMLFTLRPLVLDSEGLEAALDSMAEKTRETFQQNVVVQTDAELVDELDMNAKTVIFTIAEEAVNNARKYADAETITVKVQRLQTDLAFLEISDDGKGFDVKRVTDNYEDRDSLGMINMRERAELVDGVFHIKSQPGQGTQIQVVIPLTDDAADRLRLI